MFTTKYLSKFMVGAAVIALGTASSVPVLAANIAFNFSGVIDSVYGNKFDESVQIGTPITGSYTFSSMLQDLESSDPMIGAYSSLGDSYRLTFSAGNYTFESRGDMSNNLEIIVYNSETNGGESIYFVGGFDINTDDPFGQASEFNLALWQPWQNVFPSDDLPLTPPKLELFPSRRFDFTYEFLSNGGFDSFSGNLTSLTAAPVPELSPILGTLALATFGAAGYIFKKKYFLESRKN